MRPRPTLPPLKCCNQNGKGSKTMQDILFEELKSLLEGQSHVLNFWNELTDLEKMALAEQVKKIDVKAMNQAFQDAVTRKPFFLDGQSISRVADDRHVTRNNLTESEREEIFKTGLKAISEGQVAAIVLAGGQASRLGADRPKGVLKLGIDKNSQTDSLFYIQASRIVHLQNLARDAFPDSKGTITWMIMTSKSTNDDTKEHIEKVIKETGINPEDVILFCQNEIPCFDNDGKFMLKSKSGIFTAPDGNGGIFGAINSLLTVLESRGVKYTHVYCVDNILCKVADPYFIGCCIQKGADASAKVIEKTIPNEAVGIVCKDKDGHVCVVEYSEIPKELAEKRDESGKLHFRAGSIANHFFSVDFLKSLCAQVSHLPYHIAKKKIQNVDLRTGQVTKPEQPNGIKLEQFIFDSFYYSKNFLVWEVPKETEFSPLKNPNSAGVDCMAT